MLPLARKMKKIFSFKEIAMVVAALAISITAGVGTFSYLKKEVVINDNGKILSAKTMKNTVAEVLDQYGIGLRPEDCISMSLSTTLKNKGLNEIEIKRAVPVTLIADGQEYKVMTCKETVGEVLEDGPVRIAGADRLEGLDLDDRIVQGMNIKVVRVKEEIVSEQIPIPFKVQTRENKKMDKGTEKVVKEGQEGIREKRYRVVYEDGVEIAKELMEERIAMEPVDEIREFGSVLNFKTSRGEVVRYKKVLDMKATAYTSSFKHTGKNPGDKYYGITYSGKKAQKGIVAVDPKVIPLGTKLYIDIAGSTPDYGFAVAGDIGSAVKGNRIDLYFDDEAYVDKWGMKNAKVYILVD